MQNVFLFSHIRYLMILCFQVWKNWTKPMFSLPNRLNSLWLMTRNEIKDHETSEVCSTVRSVWFIFGSFVFYVSALATKTWCDKLWQEEQKHNKHGRHTKRITVTGPISELNESLMHRRYRRNLQILDTWKASSVCYTNQRRSKSI